MASGPWELAGFRDANFPSTFCGETSTPSRKGPCQAGSMLGTSSVSLWVKMLLKYLPGTATSSLSHEVRSPCSFSRLLILLLVQTLVFAYFQKALGFCFRLAASVDSYSLSCWVKSCCDLATYFTARVPNFRSLFSYSTCLVYWISCATPITSQNWMLFDCLAFIYRVSFQCSWMRSLKAGFQSNKTWEPKFFFFLLDIDESWLLTVWWLSANDWVWELSSVYEYLQNPRLCCKDA